MNIAQALKNKARLAGEIVELENRICTANRFDGDSTQKTYDTPALINTLIAKRKELVDLKVAITKANVKAAEILVQLSEAKAQKTFLDSLSACSGPARSVIKDRYEPTAEPVVRFSQITSVEVDTAKAEAQVLINKLQDELDVFNNKTLVKL